VHLARIMRFRTPPVIDRLALALVLSITLGVLSVRLGIAAAATACAIGGALAAVALAGGRWLLLVAGAGLCWGAVATHRADAPVQTDCVDGRSEILRGRVVGLPRRDGPAHRFDFDLDQQAPLRGCPGPGPRRLRLTWYEGPGVHSGEAWIVEVRLRSLRNFRNPGAFDYVAWAQEQGIDAGGVVRRGVPDRAPLRMLGPVDRVHALRAAIATAIRETTVEHPGVLAALAVGDGRGVPAQLWDRLRATGTIHLLVISGLHVIMAAACGLWLGRLLARAFPRFLRRYGDQGLATAAAIAAAGCYAALAGFTLPVLRACLMTALGLLWWSSGRRLTAERACGLALAALLLLDPVAVLDRSLWLSFGAAAVLVVYFGRRRGLPWSSGWLRAQAVLFAAMMPLLAGTVGQIAWVAPLANLLAVPLVSLFVVPLVLASLPLLAVAPSLAWWPLTAADRVCALLLAALEYLAAAPRTFVVGPDPWLLAASVVAAATLLLPLGWRERAWLAPLLVLMLHRDSGSTPWGEAAVTVLDVGQGLAVVVDTASHRLLYDAGARYPSGFDLGAAVVVPALRAAGRDRLDLLVVSHGDIDHSGGADAVRRELLVVAARAGTGYAAPPCHRGQTWQWDGVSFVVLHPGGAHASRNDGSCVVSIRARSGRALLPGDIGAAVELSLAQLPHEVAADLLVAAHHGSRSSSSAAFLEAVAPRVVVVSAGYRNRFGHPHPEVVDRFDASGIEWRSTVGGALTWRSDAAGELSVWERSGPLAARPPDGE
jgi:competence protein ComEC